MAPKRKPTGSTSPPPDADGAAEPDVARKEDDDEKTPLLERMHLRRPKDEPEQPEAAEDVPADARADPSTEGEPVDDDEPEPSRKRGRAARAAAIGATVLRHRDLLVQVLELLRRSGIVSPEEEARLLAAYEEGDESSRDRLSELLDKLQRANFGETVIGLVERSDLLRRDAQEEAHETLAEGGRRLFTSAADALSRHGRKLLGPEGQGTVREGRHLLRKEGRDFIKHGSKAFRRERKAMVGEGRELLEEYRGELQEFLDENQPTIEAVERVTEDLADAGRQLADSLRYAGREAADELLKRGKKAVAGIDTEEIEDAVLDETVAALPRVERGVNKVLYGIGYFWIALGIVVAAVWYPAVRPYALIIAGLFAVVVGAVFLRWAGHVRHGLEEAERRLRHIQTLPSAERRRRLVGHARRRFGEDGNLPGTPPGPAPVAGDVPPARDGEDSPPSR